MLSGKDNIFKSNQKSGLSEGSWPSSFLATPSRYLALKIWWHVPVRSPSCESEHANNSLPLIFPTPQNGAMIMVWTTRLERSGIVREKVARWWAARVLEMEKENSSAIPVRCHKSLLVPSWALPPSLLSCNSHPQKWLETLGLLEEWTVGLLIFWFGTAETSFKNEP